MKRQFYYLAVVLLSGLILTSCIKDTEPYGVKEMREAKAEFYKAEAAYKLAEAGLINANAEYRLQEVEFQKLVNILKKATDDVHIKAAQAQLIVDLRELEAKKLDADLLYDTALRNLEIGIAGNNALYTAEYVKIMARITATRAKHGNKLAAITAAKLDLVDLLTGTLDSVSVKAKLEVAIAAADLKVKYLEQQVELYESVDQIAVNDINAKMVALSEDIRNEVAKYNVGVQELNAMTEKEDIAQSAYDNKKEQLKNERQITWNTLQTKTITVPAIIQTDFAKVAAFIPNDPDPAATAADLTGRLDLVEKTTAVYNGNTIEYYALNNDVYVPERRSLSAVATTLAGSTTGLLRDEIAGYLAAGDPLEAEAMAAYMKAIANEVSSSALYSDANLDIAIANLAARTTYMNGLLTVYNNDMTIWATALARYNAAKATYMLASSDPASPQNYYQYATEVMARYTSLTTAQRTPAEQNIVITALKNYATARQGMDGWIDMTGSATTASGFVIADFTAPLFAIPAKATQILGLEPLGLTGIITGITPAEYYEDKPYGAFVKASTNAFGTAATADAALTTAPIDKYEIEHSSSHTGTYAAYIAEYQKVIELQKAIAWRDVMDQIKTLNDELDLAYATLEQQEAADEQTILPLQDAKNALTIEKTLLAAQYGTAPITVQYSGAANTIALDVIPTGALGGYISSIVGTHNALAANITNFEKEIYGDGTPTNPGILADLADAQKALFDAKQDLDFFEVNGFAHGTDYLVDAIEKQEVTITELEDEAQDLLDELASIQKELAAFLIDLGNRM